MKVAVVQNYEGTGPGQIGAALAEAGVEIDLIRADLGGELPPDASGHAGLVVLGGAQNALDDQGSPYLPRLIELMRAFDDAERPVLGICLGAQLLARAHGGRNLIGAAPEFGWHDIDLTEAGQDDPVFSTLPSRFVSFAWHDDTFTLPDGAVRLASNPAVPNQAFRVGRSSYGVQFHFEADTALVAEWSVRFGEVIAARDPLWPQRHASEAPTRGRAADAAGLAVAGAWIGLLQPR